MRAAERTHRGAGALHGQRALFATTDISVHDVIFSEAPLLCAQVALHSVMPSVPVDVAFQGLSAQHLWNREWRYRACAHCMRSIETADEMAARLSNGHAFAPAVIR